MRNKILTLLICPLVILSFTSCVVPEGGLVSYSASGLNVLPTGYKTVYVSGNPYFYSRNSWYKRTNGRYIRCARPHGYRGSIGLPYGSRYGSNSGRYGSNYGLIRLPSGYRTIAFSGQLFYNNGNSWYKKNRGRYYRCSAPNGYYQRYPWKRPSYYRNNSGYRNHSNSSYLRRSSNYRNKYDQPNRSSVYKGDLRRAVRSKLKD